MDYLPPDTEEKKQFLGRFRKDVVEKPGYVEALVSVAEEAKKGKWSGVEGWGVFGLCFGGKVRFSLPYFFGMAVVVIPEVGLIRGLCWKWRPLYDFC